MKTTRQYRDFADRIDVEAVEQELGFEPIEVRGDEARGFCFDVYGMHNNGDTTGKLYINRDKKVYNCWVCGGGSLLELTKNVRGLDDAAAIEFLYQFAQSDHQSAFEFIAEIESNFVEEPTDKRNVPMPFFNKNVLERFEDEHPWFHERGITPEVRDRFKLKFDPDGERGGTIILPHFWDGKLVGWQARFLDGQKPKYDSTVGFPKDRTVWGLDAVEGVPIVVESMATALYLHSNEHSGVATFGAEVTQEQCRLLRRFPSIFLAPDNDPAGRKWLETLTRYLDRYSMVYAVPFVDGDSADLGDVAPDQLDYFLRRANRAW